MSAFPSHKNVALVIFWTGVYTSHLCHIFIIFIQRKDLHRWKNVRKLVHRSTDYFFLELSVCSFWFIWGELDHHCWYNKFDDFVVYVEFGLDQTVQIISIFEFDFNLLLTLLQSFDLCEFFGECKFVVWRIIAIRQYYFSFKFVLVVNVNCNFPTLKRNNLIGLQCYLKLLASIKYHRRLKETQLRSNNYISLLVFYLRSIKF